MEEERKNARRVEDISNYNNYNNYDDYNDCRFVGLCVCSSLPGMAMCLGLLLQEGGNKSVLVSGESISYFYNFYNF